MFKVVKSKSPVVTRIIKFFWDVACNLQSRMSTGHVMPPKLVIIQLNTQYLKGRSTNLTQFYKPVQHSKE